MTIQQFIKKAVEGGWDDKVYRTVYYGEAAWSHFDSLFLDPAAWQAVGKMEGWDDIVNAQGGPNTPQYANWFPYSWGWRWHRMIDVLADGETIGQYLETL